MLANALWALNDVDVHIRIVTHRLVHNWAHDLVVADTVRWLQMPCSDGRPRVPYRDICFVGQKQTLEAIFTSTTHHITSKTFALPA